MKYKVKFKNLEMTKAEICSKVRPAVSILTHTKPQIPPKRLFGRAYTISILIIYKPRWYVEKCFCKKQNVKPQAFRILHQIGS